MKLPAMAVVGLAVVLAGWPAVMRGDGASSTVKIVCNDIFQKPVVRVAPLKCTILPPRASNAEGLNLIGLRWRGWGGASTVGTGFERGFHLPYLHEPVAVVAYRIIRCPDGSQLYSHIRASSSYGTTNARAQGCLAS